MFRLAGIAVFLLLCLLATACHDRAASQLDAEADRLIRLERDASLGQGPLHDAQPVPDRMVAQGPDPRPYRTEPPTRNPAPADLPARPAASQPSTQPTPMPATAPGLIEQPPSAGAMNLQEILAYAISHSPDYRSRKEDLFLTALDLLIQRHLWGPRFFDTISSQVTGTPEGGDHAQAMELINTLSVTQRLPNGGAVSAGALVDFVDQLRNGVGGDDTQAAQLFFTGTLPLLRGAGQSAREDLIQAERNLVYAGRTFEHFRRQFLVNVSTRYYDLLRLGDEIENRQRQVDNFEWLSHRTEALANAGRIALFEVQRAQQQVLFARNNLVNSREQYGAQLDALKLTIGMPIAQPVRIAPSEVVIATPEVNPTASVEAALRFRLDLQNVSDQADDARRRVDVAKNGLLPDLNLNADVRVNTDSARARGEADFDLGSSSYTAGATFGVPLDRKIEQVQYRRALVDYERSQRSLTLQRDQVALEVRLSIRQIEQARFTLELQNRNIEIANKRLRGVLLRLRSLGPRDFIEAQGDLLEARNRRDLALRDLRVSILNYLLDTGQMRVTPEGHWRLPGKLVETAPFPADPTPAQTLEADQVSRGG